MSGEFMDSNVFVYLFDETNERKRGVARLYSEDFQDGQRIESLTIENPFLES